MDAGVVLARDALVAVLDHDHPLAGQHEVRLADLRDDPFLLSDGGCEPLLQQLYRQTGLELRAARRVRDLTALFALVRERLGVTVVPELTLTSGHDLAVVPLDPATRRVLSLVPATAETAPASRALLKITRRRTPASPCSDSEEGLLTRFRPLLLSALAAAWESLRISSSSLVTVRT